MKSLVRIVACTLAATVFLSTRPAMAAQTLAQAITASMRGTNIPGAQVVIVKHGAVVLNQGYGVRNLGSQVPVDKHTRFEIGSITKQFTATAILQLKEQKKLALTDRLGKYVPEYPRAKNVTIEQLLWQVSGIPNYTAAPHFFKIATSQRGSFDAMLDLIKNKPLDFKPGTKWAYSNTNYILLGKIVELVSGKPWDTYIRTHIFVPAGMRESTFMDDEPRVADMATGYYLKNTALVPSPSFNGWAWSAGSIVSTASDLAKWDAALFGGKLLPLRDVRLMTTSGRVNGKSTMYGFGWVIDKYDGEKRIWHNGGTFGFGSTNDTYPTLGQRIIVLENNANATPAGIASSVLLNLQPQLAALEQKAAPGEDPAITARAKALWQQFQTGTLDRSQFTDKMNAALTPDVLAGAKAQFAQLGAPTAWVYHGKAAQGGYTTYEYHVTFASGVSLMVYMSVTKDGKIAGYLASPT